MEDNPSRAYPLVRNSGRADYTRNGRKKALQQFLSRVEQVNNDPYFLGKVTRVVLFGSMLKPEVERLSDVDVAVELASKEADFDRARAKNYERVEKLATQGHRFRNFLEQEGCWYWEVFGFLKGHSRVIALADYAAEKSFVLTVPHRVLFGGAESTSGPRKPQRPVRNKHPRDCPVRVRALLVACCYQELSHATYGFGQILQVGPRQEKGSAPQFDAIFGSACG